MFSKKEEDLKRSEKKRKKQTPTLIYYAWKTFVRDVADIQATIQYGA